ncbi:FABP family protein [Devriesea agamarum]|uniref:FABP family protein n=1 Tax=Devriesea agamarum TaxID=472569 RepID=UPI00155EC5F7|nr:FABP family protein [Devriesea agamarum]
MPIVLDESLDPSLYPLAWLVGEWQGEGAVQLPGEDGQDVGRRIEQTVSVAPTQTAALAWTMRTWVFDAPSPTPPTAVFAGDSDAQSQDQAKAPDQAPSRDSAQTSSDLSSDDSSEPDRTLLHEETGFWRVTGPVEGADVDKARGAKPGSPESLIPYDVEFLLAHPEGMVEIYVGQVHGPRITLNTDLVARTRTGSGHSAAVRMFGLVRGNLMWVEDQASEGREMSSYLSVELHRAS